MAGRFVSRKVASGISRSSFLVANGRGASAPVTGSAPEGGLTTLSRLFHKVAVHPSSVVSNIQGYAARNFNCSRIDSNTFPTTRVPSIITNSMKPSKRTFSSHHGSEFNMKGSAAKFDAFEAELAAMDADSNNFWKTQRWLYSFVCINVLVGIACELQLKHIRSKKSRSISQTSQSISRGSSHCPSCSMSITDDDTTENPKLI